MRIEHRTAKPKNKRRLPETWAGGVVVGADRGSRRSSAFIGSAVRYRFLTASLALQGIPRGPEPGAPSGRSSPAERRESQGAPQAARLCQFPGRSRARPVGEAARRSVGNRKERRRRRDYASSPEGAGRAQWAKQPGGSVGNRKERRRRRDYASSPEGAGRAQWAKQPGGASGIARNRYTYRLCQFPEGAGRAQWAKQPGGASGIARSAAGGATMPVPRKEPGAPSGRSSPAERRESQGAPQAARPCEFPGPVPFLASRR